MTLPVPSQQTVSVGQRLQASLWNDDVRDAVTFLLNPPVALLYNSGTVVIPNLTVTAFGFDAEKIDSYNGHDTVTNNSRYAAQVAGWYQVFAQIAGPNAGGFRALAIRVNGAATTPAASDIFPGTGNNFALHAQTMVQLTAGDYVDITMQQSSGASMNITAGSAFLGVRWVHA